MTEKSVLIVFVLSFCTIAYVWKVALVKRIQRNIEAGREWWREE